MEFFRNHELIQGSPNNLFSSKSEHVGEFRVDPNDLSIRIGDGNGHLGVVEPLLQQLQLIGGSHFS